MGQEDFKWKDLTSHVTRVKRPGVVTALNITAGDLRISLAREHIRQPGEWVMHCDALRLDTHPIGLPSDASVNDAIKAAKQVISDRLVHLGALLSRVPGSYPEKE